MYNPVGAVYLELETQRTLFNLLQFMTSFTDSAFFNERFLNKKR